MSEPFSLNLQYWLDHRAQIIEALAAEGLEIWSDKDRVWLHHVKGSELAAVRASRDALAVALKGALGTMKLQRDVIEHGMFAHAWKHPIDAIETVLAQHANGAGMSKSDEGGEGPEHG